MLQVHGTFVPAGAAGFFFLWALDPDLGGDAAEGAAARPHRQAVAPERLYPLLRGLPYAHACSCYVHLPGPRGLRPGKVPGVALAVSAAVQWLLDLEGAFAGLPLQPGRSLQGWSVAAKLLLELLGRGRCVPVIRVEAGCQTAAWQLCPAEPEDAERVVRLELALPDVCRAVVPPDRDHRTYRAPAAGDLLRMFLQSGAAALTRVLLHDALRPAHAVAGHWAAHHWVAALSGRAHPDFPPGLPDAEALHRAVDGWLAPIRVARGHVALRTGLRLNLPDVTEHGGWELELVLLDGGDPPALAGAEAAWAALGGELALGNERYRDAEQRILSDLPAMIRLFPALEPLRFAAAPARIEIDVDTVAAFLREGAAALQAGSFPTFLPDGLLRADKVRMRMHLRPGGAGETRFGLDQMVAVNWDLALAELPITLAELRALARQKRPLLHHRGRYIQVDEAALATALRHLEPHQERIDLRTVLRLAPAVAATSAEGWVGDLLDRLREPARLTPVPVPPGFAGVLRPYQQRGLDWLAFLRQFGLGACLADDMGLGKTVQLIGLLLHEREQGLGAGPTLLVCPVSLVGNWRREVARFAPGLRVLIHHGAARTAAASFAAAALEHDLVITTYGLVARDESELTAVAWRGVVADEAQQVKNPATQQAQTLRRLPAGYRVALTGTPVENQLADLWSLFAFLNPGLLGSAEEFRRRFALPIERYRDPDATADLRRQVGPFLLRRLKSDPAIIADLPEKVENTMVVSLTVEQAALYEAVVEETLARAAAATGIQRHGAVLAGLTRLKQVCNHPAAVTGDSGALAGRSGKLERLVEMLAEVLAEGDAALVFTQFAQFGARLQAHIDQRLGCASLFLDGSTPQPERERRIARFQAGAAPVFVLSLRAGGVGLNLTAAQHVFHFDRWWNPAVEDQATDRAHRIGQTRRVLVHKLVTAGTLEERIDRLLADKRFLSDQVIGDGEGWLGELSTDELRALITLERE